jgi:NitT/TauT family transport system permease protein
VFWKIVLPESAPGIFAGLRVALSMSFVLIIVTEMFIGTTVGLGYRIINSQLVYRVPEMYAAIVLAGLTGYFANLSLLSVERRLLHWVGK